MKTRKSLSTCVLVGILSSTTAPGVAATLEPVADGIVEDGLEAPEDGIPDAVLDGSVVQLLDVPRFEHRGIIEFSLANLSAPISRAKLELPVFASNGPFPFTVDVFAYSGDGLLTLADWSGGTLLQSFVYRHKKVVRLDVTSAVREALASGQQFIGFRFEFSEPSQIERNGPFLAFSSIEFPPPATLRINERGAGGSLTGVGAIEVICHNMTTGQIVTIHTIGDEAWDCAEAGLDIRPGDEVMQTTKGRAD
jgi:hypothetical protein